MITDLVPLEATNNAGGDVSCYCSLCGDEFDAACRAVPCATLEPHTVMDCVEVLKRDVDALNDAAVRFERERDAARDLLRRFVDGADSAIFAVDWLDVADELVAEARKLLSGS